MNKRTNNKGKRIALVAADHTKADLIHWLYINRELFNGHQLLAPGATADIAAGTLNQPVQKLMQTAKGGNQQLRELVSGGQLDMIIFFDEVLQSMRDDQSTQSLFSLAVSNNVLIAANRSTAQHVLHAVSSANKLAA